jgi:hypothetical protein
LSAGVTPSAITYVLFKMAAKTRWKIAKPYVRHAMQENFGTNTTRENNFQQVFFWKPEKIFKSFEVAKKAPLPGFGSTKNSNRLTFVLLFM